MKRPELITGLFVSIVLVLLAGQAISYWADPYEFGSGVSIGDEGIEYEIHSSANIAYSVLAFDKASDLDIYLYYDSKYGTSQITHENVSEILHELDLELNLRGNQSEGYLDAQQIVELFETDLVRGSAKGHAVVFASGVFPDTVYSGSQDDIIFKWLESGGTIYWINGCTGKNYSDSNGVLSEVRDYGTLFFGQSDAVNDNKGFGVELGRDRNIGKLLSVYYSETTHGLNSNLPNMLSIGFVNENYCSVAIAGYKDSGSICVFGGTTDRDGGNRNSSKYVAQVISSGINYDSRLLYVDDSVMSSGSFSGTIPGGISVNVGSVYIYLGQTLGVYGKMYNMVYSDTD